MLPIPRNRRANSYPPLGTSPADVSDSAGATAILEAIRKRWPWVKHLFADGAYDRLKLMDKAAYLDFIVEIIRRCDDQKGFQVMPRCWVVERTFGWMMRFRVDLIERAIDRPDYHPRPF